MKRKGLILTLLILSVITGCANKSAVENSFKESSFINLNNKNRNTVNTVNIQKTYSNIISESLNKKNNIQNKNTDSNTGKITLKKPEIKIEDDSVVKDDDKEFNFKIGKINEKKINTNTKKIKLNKIKKIDILNK